MTDDNLTPADGWESAGWKDAALEYRQQRGERRLVVETDPQRLAQLRRLMADGISIERAWSELNQRDRSAPAPQATVEALIFSLRKRGVQALKEPATLRRLSEINEAQSLEVAERVRKFKPNFAPAWDPDGPDVPAWTPDGVEVLLRTWTKCHGR